VRHNVNNGSARFDSSDAAEQMVRVFAEKSCKTSGNLPPSMSTSLEGGVEVIMSRVASGNERKSACFPRLQLLLVPSGFYYCVLLRFSFLSFCCDWGERQQSHVTHFDQSQPFSSQISNKNKQNKF